MTSNMYHYQVLTKMMRIIATVIQHYVDKDDFMTQSHHVCDRGTGQTWRDKTFWRGCCWPTWHALYYDNKNIAEDISHFISLHHYGKTTTITLPQTDKTDWLPQQWQPKVGNQIKKRREDSTEVKVTYWVSFQTYRIHSVSQVTRYPYQITAIYDWAIHAQ